MVALTIVVPFNMLWISLEPCIYGSHIFVSSTSLTKVIIDLLWNTHLLFMFTALQIRHGFNPLAMGVTCSKKFSFVSYSKTHLIVNYSNSHLCAASTLTKPQIYSISANRKSGSSKEKRRMVHVWVIDVNRHDCLSLSYLYRPQCIALRICLNGCKCHIMSQLLPY